MHKKVKIFAFYTSDKFTPMLFVLIAQGFCVYNCFPLAHSYGSGYNGHKETRERDAMKIAVIDGQGGRIGRMIVSAIKKANARFILIMIPPHIGMIPL